MEERDYYKVNVGSHVEIRFDFFLRSKPEMQQFTARVIARHGETIEYHRDDGLPTPECIGGNWGCHVHWVDHVIYDEPYRCIESQPINFARTFLARDAEHDRKRKVSDEWEAENPGKRFNLDAPKELSAYRNISDEEAWHHPLTWSSWNPIKSGGLVTAHRVEDLLIAALARADRVDRPLRTDPKFATITAQALWEKQGCIGLVSKGTFSYNVHADFVSEAPYSYTVRWKTFLRWVLRNQSKLLYTKKELCAIEKDNEEWSYQRLAEEELRESGETAFDSDT